MKTANCQICQDLPQAPGTGRAKMTCDRCRKTAACPRCKTRVPKTGQQGRPALCSDCKDTTCSRCHTEKTGSPYRKFCESCLSIRRSEVSTANGRAGKGRISKNRNMFELNSYSSANRRAKFLIQNTGCALKDDTCHGKPVMTLWHGSAPLEWVRIDPGKGRPDRYYWIGPEDQITKAYRWLCSSHSHRTHPQLVRVTERLIAYKAMKKMTDKRRARIPGTWAEYQQVHVRARSLFGSGARCLEDGSECDGPLEAALSPFVRAERLRYVSDNPKHPQSDYSQYPADYLPLCRRHHRHLDFG